MTRERLARGRKAIGAGALLVATVVALWTSAPDWAVTVGAGAAWLATWGLPNAITARQRAELRDQIEAGTLRL